MNKMRPLTSRVIDGLLVFISILTFPICIGYSLAFAYLTPLAGLEFDSDWSVCSVDSCEKHLGWCENNPGDIQPEDRLLTIGNLDYQTYAADKTKVPFGGYGPGDLVEISLMRQGQERTVQWRLPPITLRDRIVNLSGTLIYFPFLLVGAAALLFLRPRDERWRVLILLNDVTAVWLAAGSISTWQVAYSSLVLGSTTWFMAPIYLHLHLIVPSSLIRRKRRLVLPLLYIPAMILAVAQFLQWLPMVLYLLGLILAIGGSLGLLTYRAIRGTPGVERLTSRWLLTGFALAFGPGLSLWIVPNLLGVLIASEWVGRLTALSVPALPLFYTYAIFKRQVGDLEFRANRLLGFYTFLILYVTVYTLVLSIGGQWVHSMDLSHLFTSVVSILFIAAAPTLLSSYHRLFNRLAYGTQYRPEDIVQRFASRIPTVADRQALVDLLEDEIAPSLLVRQSALCLLQEDRVSLVYSRNIDEGELRSPEQLRQLLKDANHYRPIQADREIALAWVRLVVPLRVGEEPIGVWLFGRRDPDDFYPRGDIDLLYALANQIALAVENARLFEDSQRRTQELASLYQMALVTGSVLDKDTLLHRLYRYVRDSIPLDTFVVVLCGQDEDRYEVVFAMERGEEVHEAAGMQLPIKGGGLTGWVIQEGQSLHVGDLKTDSLPVEPHHGAHPARAWLGVPLIALNRTVGAVSVQSFQPQAFSSADLRFLEAMAGQLAMALENTQLFDEARNRAAQQEALNAIISAAAVVTDLTDLLDAALDHMLQALDLHKGAAWLEDPPIFRARALPDGYQHAPLWVALISHLKHPTALAVVDWDRNPPQEMGEVMPNPFPKQLEVRASITVPLSVSGVRIGGLTLVSSQPRRWTQEEVSLAEAVGQQLGGAIERVRLIERIRYQVQQTQHILETVEEGIFTLDSERRITLANPVAQHCLRDLGGVGEGDILERLAERPITEILVPRSDGLPHEITLDGATPRTFEVLATTARSGGVKRGWTLLIREVTEARRVQDLARQQDRLAAVGQLAAGIAHDFNNIMAAIILFSEMLQEEPDLTEKGHERLSVIIEQAHRAATLTRQILDFGRQTIMDLHPMNLVPFLKEFMKLLERTLPESIQLELSCQDAECLVRADPSRIQQVLMNLALNARDAMREGGVLRIELSQWMLGAGMQPPLPNMAQGRWIRLCVSDNGMGIAPENLPHIFEPFFTTKAAGQGTGLGLAQVYGIVRQHNGYIDVVSQLGQGTSFTIYLPALAIPLSSLPKAKKKEPTSGKGQTILVVEDQDGPREAICQMLETLNYQVLVAKNGQEALTHFEAGRERVDLVLSDMVMPEMGGMALYRELRKLNPEVQVVLITGYPLGGETRQLLDQDHVTWVQKPFDAEVLARTVGEMLQTENPQDP